MKKLGVLLTLLVLCSFSVSAAIDWTSTVPINGTAIPGSTTQPFELVVNETVTSSFLYLNGAGPYAMATSGMTANTTKDVLVLSELQWYPFYFVTNGYISPSYTFYLDKVPSAPTWASPAYTATETSVSLNWLDNPEADIVSYSVFRNGTRLANMTNSTYVDATVSVGETWSYTVTATDAAVQESVESTPEVILIQDSTPPQVPDVSITSGSCSGAVDKSCTTTSLNPIVTVDYVTENTSTFRVTTGGITYFQDAGNQVYNVPMTFATDGVYLFEMNASDATGNERLTDLVVDVDNGTVVVNVQINDVNHISATPFGVKTSALSNGADWLVIGYDISMYYDATEPLYVRAAMPDITGPQTLEVNETLQPYLFCEDDYDPLTQDYDGSGPLYWVDNSFDETQNAVTCNDLDSGSGVKYPVYLAIPIPAGTQSGSYNVDVDFGMYDSLI